jgi:hypothetical protein
MRCDYGDIDYRKAAAGGLIVFIGGIGLQGRIAGDFAESGTVVRKDDDKSLED